MIFSIVVDFEQNFYADVTIDDVTSYDVTDVDDDSLIIQVNGVYHNSLHQPLSV